jgi:hypothetical protein
MSPAHALVVAMAACFLAASVDASEPVQFTQCGDPVGPGRTAFLTGDLTCPTDAGTIAVRLGSNAKLNLNGFTLSGGYTGVACDWTVCDIAGCTATKNRKCTVYGGTLAGAKHTEVVGGIVELHDMTMRDGDSFAVRALSRIRVENSHLENFPAALSANKKITIQDSTIENVIVSAPDVILKSSAITNDVDGVFARTVRMTNSSVTGAGSDPNCTEIVCADLVTERMPRLDATSSCGTSQHYAPPDYLGPWGVCTND